MACLLVVRVCTDSLESEQRALGRNLRGFRPERGIVRLVDRDLEIEAFRVAEQERRGLLLGRDSLGAEALCPEFERLLAGNPPDDAVHHSDACSSRRGIWKLEEGENAPRCSELRSVIQ